jgi:hypothetical protein
MFEYIMLIKIETILNSGRFWRNGLREVTGVDGDA